MRKATAETDVVEVRDVQIVSRWVGWRRLGQIDDSVITNVIVGLQAN